VLLAERPLHKSMPGLWEFPGGKVHTNETPEAALVRELKEELGVETSPGCLSPLAFASHAYADFHLLMPLFACRVWHGTPRGLEGQKLAWASKQEFHNYAMPPADIALVQTLWELI
jgi:8-oxo-dGTP diphosphatase